MFSLNIWFLFFLLFAFLPVHACGWWGDGEVNIDIDFIPTDPGGKPLPQELSLATAKLPGRMGYGIAVPDPGRTIPYLLTTKGRPINRIADLKIFGYETVIDLGTAEKAAQFHRQETEALGMRYFSIPVNESLPSPQQVKLFTRYVIDASHHKLLVYAPNAALLGNMWAAYRINLGAPLELAIKQGYALGMSHEQANQLRSRAATN